MPRSKDAAASASVYEGEEMGLMGTGAQTRSYEKPSRGRGRSCALALALLLLVLSMVSNVVLAFTVNTLADGDFSSFSSFNTALGALGLTDEDPPVTAFTVSFPEGAGPDTDVDHPARLDGRIYLLLSKLSSPEPRLQVHGQTTAATVALFGQDVDDVAGGDVVAVTTAAGAVGYPFKTLEGVAAGNYYAQAVLVTYENFNLTTGHRVKLPAHDRGDGMKWVRAPGNLYSTPRRVTLGPEDTGSYELSMTNVVPPIPNQGIGQDTEYVKHLRVVSPLLSEFWGREIWLGAIVLLPFGFNDYPEARYPIMVDHGHYPSDMTLQTTPPDPNMEATYSDRFHLDGYNIIEEQEAYDFYRKWTGQPNYPRHLVLQIQHPTPYYDDSYAVNSAAMGPWGDAIMHELLPEVERQFRGIGEGWARFTYGGSTGGWEALAVQLFYPDEFNGCFAACPDPIDFRATATFNLYDDANAYYYETPNELNPNTLKRPMGRDYLGELHGTVAEANWLEAALGSHGRSAEQWDIWQAVYSPQGADGYPLPIWDKETGVIDKAVAQHWQENYDLSYILQRDWATLWPKVAGKIHVFVGDMDTYYLNNAVYKFQEMLEEQGAAPSDYEVDYGDRAEHCWNGDHENGNGISRLRYNTMYMERIMARIAESAPLGADTTSWRY